MEWADDKQKSGWGRIATLSEQWGNSLAAFIKASRGAAEALQFVEQLGNDGDEATTTVRQDALEEAQDDLKVSEIKYNRKSKTLMDLVDTRNGELAGDGTLAVKRLVSLQFQDTFDKVVATLQCDSTGVPEAWAPGRISPVAPEVCTDQYV